MMTKKLQLMGLLLAVTVLLVACGDHLIRGVSPVVRMNELSHDGQNITLQLSLRNRNGIEMDVQHMKFSLLAEDVELLSYDGPASTTIAANGTETWSVDVNEYDTSVSKLNALENGDIKSLRYTFKGTVTAVKAGKLNFEYEGHLYPVPGRPGRFR